jgi:hypothetical protein
MNSETARFAFHHDLPQEQSECHDGESRTKVRRFGIAGQELE